MDEKERSKEGYGAARKRERIVGNKDTGEREVPQVLAGFLLCS